MKRFATVLLALVLGGSALPAAADPGAFADVAQMAQADWVVMHGRDDATMYFVAGARSVSESGLRTLGVVGSGKCDVERGRHWTMISCHGGGRVRELELDQFDFDPALRSASLTMKVDGEKNTATWRGVGRIPWNGGSVSGGDGFAAVDVMTARMARVKAHLLGRNMPRSSRRSLSFAFLTQGATAYVYGDYGSRSFVIEPDGTFSYDVELRLPR